MSENTLTKKVDASSFATTGAMGNYMIQKLKWITSAIKLIKGITCSYPSFKGYVTILCDFLTLIQLYRKQFGKRTLLGTGMIVTSVTLKCICSVDNQNCA